MLPIAGQTAGPIFFGHSWVAGVCLRLKKFKFFFSKFLVLLFFYFFPGNASASLHKIGLPNNNICDFVMLIFLGLVKSNRKYLTPRIHTVTPIP